ncbi:dienelactone hydrolase family protein [Luteibacter aegosomatissinici]|uniref:dienelactone hydrolase family protein n=1 Tax=Luteibacter aegosomatissinici TaxID=2911539 RepID=UPI001FF835C9|nr:dienelactone hydrolase family protein [Luteibacter aegosomatissinici]UPG93785.1 dienelactone hydrolase family protein [Luteibacter aegosomatissinici]
MRRTLLALSLLVMGAAGSAHAAMVAKPVQWTEGGVTYKSFLVYDDAVKTKRPGLVMVPNWYGINDMAVAKAKEIAGRDYVILLTDMYGGDTRPKSADEAGAAVKPLYGDRKLMRARVTRALDELKAQEKNAPIDPAHLAAIGFCFGGSAVLDLARTGADVAAVVTFHGLLSDDSKLGSKIQPNTHVLALNGADDANVPPEQRAAFEAEMRADKIDWASVDYGNAVHCFTEKEATDATGNCRYDAKVATRAYAAMKAWLTEAFKK